MYKASIRYILTIIRIFKLISMEYKKKSLTNLDIKKDYEEIDTRLASGWYVDDIHLSKKKIYKTNKTSFKISKKINS